MRNHADSPLLLWPPPPLPPGSDLHVQSESSSGVAWKTGFGHSNANPLPNLTPVWLLSVSSGLQSQLALHPSDTQEGPRVLPEDSAGLCRCARRTLPLSLTCVFMTFPHSGLNSPLPQIAIAHEAQ